MKIPWQEKGLDVELVTLLSSCGEANPQTRLGLKVLKKIARLNFFGAVTSIVFSISAAFRGKYIVGTF